MYAQELLLTCLGSVDIPEYVGQPGRDELILNCRQALSIFRMTFTRVVFAALRVADVGGAQCGIPVLRFRCYPV